MANEEGKGRSFDALKLEGNELVRRGGKCAEAARTVVMLVEWMQPTLGSLVACDCRAPLQGTRPSCDHCTTCPSPPLIHPGP